MRLRAIHLGNVRKFAGRRASITGIGDGISVVSAANEFGKSTFFDALHALFFEKYSSGGKPVKSLQPYSKGAVEVAAEIETDDGLFRIEKRFLSRSAARVFRLPDEALIAQDDEAERWISTLLGTAADGPAGLLWVRQGLVGLEPDSKPEQARLTEARRDLLSSVSGEIDAMTGGRRMDRVMRRVAEDLKPLVTATGKPTGVWRALNNDITTMEGELAALNAQVTLLEDALSGRKQAEGQLTRLNQAGANTRRAAAVSAAQTAYDGATAHAGRVEAAAQARDLAALQHRTARGNLDQFLKAVEALDVAGVAALATTKTAEDAATEAARLHSLQDTAQGAKANAAAAVANRRSALETARQQTAARAARTRAQDLHTQLQKIEQAQDDHDKALARVTASGATPAWLQNVEAAKDAVTKQEAALTAQSVTVSVAYSGDTRVTRDGAVLPDREPVTLSGATELTLPGIGQMSLDLPQSGQGARAELIRCQAALGDLLGQAGATTLRDARALAAERTEAKQEVGLALAILKTLAPDGADTLRAAKAIADLAAQAAHDDPLPPLGELEEALAQAQTLDQTAQNALAQANAEHTTARETALLAQVAAQAATSALERAQVDAGPAEAQDATRVDLIRVDAQSKQDLSIKSGALEDLRAEAPDLATAQAELTRAKDAVQGAVTQHQQLSVRVAEYSAEIRTHASNSIEALRDDLSGQLESARADEARFAHKAAALTRLQTALEAERSAARDTYFGPVQAELKPLLAILYKDAGLHFDSDSLLPAGLTRADTAETFDNLSGGTQEQIAILTRLAFARLFARQGRHMPIVLDDALVYSDDDRIVKMFTALTRVASDQQILVFTCRTMAFADLGGGRPQVTVRDQKDGA